MEKRCVIIGAGEFLEKSLDLRKDDFVIAADGGYAHCFTVGVDPHLIVADFDSFRGIVEGVEVVKSIPEKDDTDMMLAIREGLKRGYKEFVIYGALGGRIAHSLGNIGCLHYLNKYDAHGVLISKNCKVEVLSKGIYTYEDEGYISIFSMSEKTIVSLRDLKYEVDHYELNNYTTIGVDNEFINKKATIEIHEGVLIVVRNKESLW